MLFFKDFATFFLNCVFFKRMYSFGFIIYATSTSTLTGFVARVSAKLDLCIPLSLILKSFAKLNFIISAARGSYK